MKTVDELLDDARKSLPERPSPLQTLKEIAEGVFVVDIRGDEQQRRDGLIPGATIIRRNVLEWRCDPKSEWRHNKVTGHDQRIILVCDEGYQSSLAAANLQAMGMTNTSDMAGGFQRWKSEGLPIAPYGAGLKFKEAVAEWWQRLVPASFRYALQKKRARR